VGHIAQSYQPAFGASGVFDGGGEGFGHAQVGVNAYAHFAAETAQQRGDLVVAFAHDGQHARQRGQHILRAGRDHNFPIGQRLQQFVLYAGRIEASTASGCQQDAC
jgi:hypothetical protein